MAHFEHSVVINRPVEEVFEYMLDIHKVAQWRSGLVESEKTSEGPTGVGSTWREVETFLGRKMDSTNEMTEFEANKRFSYKATSGPIPLEGGFTFESVEGGTRVTASFDTELGGFFRLAEPIVMRMARRQMEADFANLEDLLESQA
jgi:uncharacterized membrane protein